MRDALGWLLTYWTIARGMGHLVSLALGHLDASVAVADNLPSPVARIRFAVASLSLFIRANVWCSHALLCVTCGLVLLTARATPAVLSHVDAHALSLCV